MAALEEYEWILVLGAIAALFAAFGIGANDVANAWATCVGARSLTIRQACFAALIAESAGAVAAGSAVAETFRKGIADPKCFDDNRNDAALLIYGNLAVIITVGFWLFVATMYEMPVSTTHTAVGGMIGMAIAVKGTTCVVWNKKSGIDRLYIPQGVSGIVASWIFSPFLSMFFAMALYATVRYGIMRHKNSFNRAIAFYPVLVFFAVAINSFFVLAKGISKKICPNKADETIVCFHGKVRYETAAWMSLVIAAGVTLLITPLYYKIGRWAKEYVANLNGQLPKDGKEAPAGSKDIVMQRTVSYEVAVDDGSVKGEAANNKEAEAMGFEDDSVDTSRLARLSSFACRKWVRFVYILRNWPDVDVHTSGTETQAVKDVHANAEVFDEEAEAVFRYIQVFTAMCDSFAHGANDVANAMGPFMTIYSVYHAGKVSKKVDTDDDAYWILAMGGVGMGIGLFAYGYKIIRAIGVKLAKVTPSRGFSIELAAAMVIILGSYLGIPLSTTHCQVGATAGVGLLEGKAGINKRTLLITIAGWILTLIVAGLGAGLLTAQGVYAPSVEKLHLENITQGRRW
eukprot:m.164301 g.164301  ORF g.164301 m.164301 type:complete len:572 (+) comp12403_c0_seq1:156-1871(+)